MPWWMQYLQDNITNQHLIWKLWSLGFIWYPSEVAEAVSLASGGRWTDQWQKEKNRRRKFGICHFLRWRGMQHLKRILRKSVFRFEIELLAYVIKILKKIFFWNSPQKSCRFLATRPNFWTAIHDMLKMTIQPLSQYNFRKRFLILLCSSCVKW